jgi:carbamoyl-phosphate synthase large subunit
MTPHTPHKVLVLGSGALKIGEAGEFDYSGSQAIKALKDEGIPTVLVNPNIATIQTSDAFADQVYFLPVTAACVEGVIAKERPDGLLLGFGGQTALNCGLALAQHGVLERYGVQVLGTPIQAIRETEDRALFVERLTALGIKTPHSAVAASVHEAVEVAQQLGYPVMLRVAYALGGLGSGLCTTVEAVRQRATKALAHSPQVLVEEYLRGWKEVEYEVVRDRFDNCVTVCNMENVDPMGIHTGDSIVVAPSQTLTNAEYHWLRQIALQVVRQLGIVGECNIQFALDPHAQDYRVIEVNARLSRSSALASKATGYPLAFIAAKLGLGYNLADLRNVLSGETTACFEPALDYVVVKVPRWDLRKFHHVSPRLGSQMKSVGEVMAIGRRFEEALQKALRMLDIGVCGLVGNDHLRFPDLERELHEPTPERLFAIAEALRQGETVERLATLSGIDPWFLYKLRTIVELAEDLRHHAGQPCPRPLLLAAKQTGFADRQIATLTQRQEHQVRCQRETEGIVPCVKGIDTLAAEHPASTNYLYLTYNGYDDDHSGAAANTVLVLGSGAYRIGSSVEFDWCCVNAVQTLRQRGYHTVLLNYNPETVSTDANECDTLYFDELSLETILAIVQKERPLGIVGAMGGQIPNNLALPLHEAGLTILGTSPTSIDTAEDRHKFAQLLDQLGIAQPAWKELVSLDAAQAFANAVGYPVLVRPSYVLSGAAMGVAMNDTELRQFVARATTQLPPSAIVISKFVEHAQELDLDAVACHGELVVAAIAEHVEHAGVHSGDATLVLPPQHTERAILRRMRTIAARVARALRLHGPFNMQFLARGDDIQVIECNVRVSRSFPFVSKMLKVNFIDLATRVIMGEAVPRFPGALVDVDYVGVKAPQFSFVRLDGADPTLGVEMASTGEVACLGEDFAEALLKALLAVGYRLPVRHVLLSMGPLQAKRALRNSARTLQHLGIHLYATAGTAAFLAAHRVATTLLHGPLEAHSPNTMEYLSQGKIDLVINIPQPGQADERTNDYLLRRGAVDFGVPLLTNIQLTQHVVAALACKHPAALALKSWGEYATTTTRRVA